MIRPITEADRPALLEMMRTFYESPAVSTNGSAEIFNRNIDTCLADGPYLKGYVLELDGEAKGYALLAISHASEFGCPCVWIEDLYVTEGCRSQGLGREFLTFDNCSGTNIVFNNDICTSSVGNNVYTIFK